MSLLVGLSGYARSGKDTAAKVLTEGSWVRESFADRLRAFLLALDPIVDGEVDSYGEGCCDMCYSVVHEIKPTRLSEIIHRVGCERAKDDYAEVRELLQRCGTEAGRKVLGADVWVNAVFADWDGSTPVVVTDVRFPNEAEAIVKRGGIVLRVERPGVGPRTDDWGNVHPSETALDDWDFDRVIANDGSLDDLHGRVVKAVADLVTL